MMAGDHHHSPITTWHGLINPNERTRRSPGEAGTKTGASRAFYVEGVPHAVILLQGRRP